MNNISLSSRFGVVHVYKTFAMIAFLANITLLVFVFNNEYLGKSDGLDFYITAVFMQVITFLTVSSWVLFLPILELFVRNFGDEKIMSCCEAISDETLNLYRLSCNVLLWINVLLVLVGVTAYFCALVYSLDFFIAKSTLHFSMIFYSLLSLFILDVRNKLFNT